ncbi:MAG: sigma factor-like helix-turn-helix DNA-binding protein, partial [Pseudomonadota bacterium]
YRTALASTRKLVRHEGHDEADEAIPAAQSGTELVEAAFLGREILAALEKLPMTQRATVILTHHFGYRLTEIAAITGCPEGTVKTRLFHARARLRTLLSGEGA